MRALIILIFLFISLKAFGETLCIAHRGDNINFLENSQSAFESAVRIGVDGLEFDLRHTKEGVALVMHDSTLKRVSKSKENMNCPLDEKIKNLSLSEIRSNCILQNDEEIMTLEEALSLLENSQIIRVIEFKDSPSQETLNLIEEKMNSIPSKIKIISFSKKLLRRVKKSSPFFKEVSFLNLNFLWINPFSRTRTNVFHGSFLLHWFPKFMNLNYAIYTVDKESRIKKAIKKEVPMITTNNPKLCMELKKK